VYHRFTDSYRADMNAYIDTTCESCQTKESNWREGWFGWAALHISCQASPVLVGERAEWLPVRVKAS